MEGCLRTGGELATGRDTTNVGTIRTKQGIHSAGDGVIKRGWCGGGSGGEGFGETAAIGSITAAGVAFHNGIVFGAILKRADGWCLVFEIQVEESGNNEDGDDECEEEFGWEFHILLMKNDFSGDESKINKKKEDAFETRDSVFGTSEVVEGYQTEDKEEKAY